MEDPQGQAWIYTYTNGLLTRVSDDTTNRYLNLNYDQGRLTSIDDSSNRQVSYYYTNDNLTSAVDVLSQTWTYRYDDQRFPHHLTEVVNPRTIPVERTEYDDQGRAVRQFDGEGNLVMELTYYDFVFDDIILASFAKMSDGEGNQSSHVYGPRDAISNQTQILVPGCANNDCYGQNSTVIKDYDSNFRSSWIKDANDHVTELDWSDNGANLLQLVNSAGLTTTMGYDGLNNLTAIKDSLGYTSTYSYTANLLTRSADALGNDTVYTYTTAVDWPQPPGSAQSRPRSPGKRN